MANKISHGRSGLACMPSSDAVQKRLATLLAEARKLKILLKTAKQLEREVSRHQGEDHDTK